MQQMVSSRMRILMLLLSQTHQQQRGRSLGHSLVTWSFSRLSRLDSSSRWSQPQQRQQSPLQPAPQGKGLLMVLVTACLI
jgi:hypothetical protein